MLFSPNVNTSLRRDISGVTGMKMVNLLGRYLGFPSHLSRNKSELNFLKGKVQKVLADWKGSCSLVEERMC